MKTARIGIIGCGNMSRYHGKAFVNDVARGRVVALCDPNPSMLDRYQREVFDPAEQKPATFADYREMLSQVELDGVMLVTPHTLHFEQATAALDAGCHVLVEKPMVVRSDHARKLIAHAKRKRRVLSVGLQGTYSPEFAYIRGLFATGGLGDVVAVTGQIGQGWLRATRGTWRADPSLSGGGFAYDSGAHLLHAMWYLPGVRPVTVSAAIDNCGARVDIVTTAMIRYANGAMGTVACIGRDVHWDENVYVVTTGGSIRTSVHGGRLEHWDAKGKLVCYPAVKAVSSMHQNFVDCILGRAETPCPPIWGLRQALLMEALYESARTGKPAQVAAE